jgi:hypothetical protein
LAKDILALGGISPGEPIWVARDPKGGTYTVIEGNRRITTLKILDNPALADGSEIERQIRDLSVEFAKRPIRELTACVFSSFEDAEPWRRRRHLSSGSGVGLEPWGTLAKGRADRDHGKSTRRVLAVYEYLQDMSEDWRDIATTLDSRWTTVERVLNAPPVKELLGIDIHPRSGEITFENGDFADIENKDDREAFLKKFVSQSVKVTKAIDAPKEKAKGSPPPASGDDAPPSPPGKPRKPKMDTTKRTTLAPRTGARTLHVGGVRLNQLYRECREITVKKNENAAALLLRVFLEMSTEAFLTTKNVSIPSSLGKSKGATKWDDIGISLAAKIQCAINYLDPTGKAKPYQSARVAIDHQSHSLSSINTLHGYFHNRLLNPQASDIMKAWDNWEGYLTELHNAP